MGTTTTEGATKTTKYLTTGQAADKWGVTDRTIRYWIANGLLAADRIQDDGRKNWRIPANAVRPRPRTYNYTLTTLVRFLHQNRQQIAEKYPTDDLLTAIIAALDVMTDNFPVQTAIRGAFPDIQPEAKTRPQFSRAANPFYG